MQVLRALKTAGQFNLAQGTKKTEEMNGKRFYKKTTCSDEMVIPVPVYLLYTFRKKTLTENLMELIFKNRVRQ